jgi:hypothetical protein
MMKKISLLLPMVFFTIQSYSQTIVNGSFENWISRGNKQAPANWDCDTNSINNGTIKKITGGSVGQFAIHLGTASVNGNVEGALIQRFDSLTATPGNLMFDYKVLNNNTSAVNGLYIEIYFFDAKRKNIKDFNITLSNNQSSFAKGELPISFQASEIPKYYNLVISYFNVGGLTNESTVVDNLRFAGANSVLIKDKVSPIKIYPNPTKGKLNFDNKPEDKLTSVRLISVTGQEVSYEVYQNSIDISNLDAGLYSLELFNSDNTLIGREKISLIQ